MSALLFFSEYLINFDSNKSVNNDISKRSDEEMIDSVEPFFPAAAAVVAASV